jgi:plastocyanin
MSSTHTRVLLPALALAVTLTGCTAQAPAQSESGRTSQAPPAAAAPAGKKVDPATAGSITGRVRFDGPRPTPDVVRLSADAGCVQNGRNTAQSDAVLISSDGALANAFVYIKDGLDPAYTFDTPATPVTLDQKGCFFEPRVLGIRVGQPLDVGNDDPTFHNVHAMPRMNMEYNQGLTAGAGRLRRTFTTPEVMMRFKCDVHAWMTAWIGVVAHPYFAVTGTDGSFTLAGVPPGTYTVEAWHERFGTRTAQVVVGDGQAQQVAFSFAR